MPPFGDALRYQGRDGFEVTALGDATLLMQRWAPQGPMLLVLTHLRGASQVDLGQHALSRHVRGRRWEMVLTTEDAPFAADCQSAATRSDGTSTGRPLSATRNRDLAGNRSNCSARLSTPKR